MYIMRQSHSKFYSIYTCYSYPIRTDSSQYTQSPIGSSLHSLTFFFYGGVIGQSITAFIMEKLEAYFYTEIFSWIFAIGTS